MLVLLRRFIHDYAIDRRQLEDPLNGARTLTNLLHLAEYLQKTSRQHQGTQALIRHYSDVLQNHTKEELLRLESDDDLIRIITIHKSKGLQYPLVFLPFICSPPFQGTRSPRAHIAQIPGEPGAARRIELDARNSEEATDIMQREQLAEDLRLLYVALTRAEHALWLGCGSVGQQANAKTSSLPGTALGYLFKSQLDIKGAQLVSDDTLLNQALQQLASRHPGIVVESFAAENPTPESLNAEGLTDGSGEHTTLQAWHKASAPLKKARRVSRPIADHWWIASYSALKKGGKTQPEPEQAMIDQQREEQEAQQDLALRERSEEKAGNTFTTTLPGLHGMHRGAEAGTLLHELLEWSFDYGISNALTESDPRRTYLEQRLARHGWQVELEFLFPVDNVSTQDIDQLCQQYLLPGQPRPALSAIDLNGMMKGFIDLVFSYQDKYFVVDWKSNWLGGQNTDYHSDSMAREILDKRYDVQYALYLLALHRLLSYRKADYDYESDIGGALYFFLRGWQSDTQGLFADQPDNRFIEKLNAVFLGQSLSQRTQPEKHEVSGKQREPAEQSEKGESAS